jgi:hypothetical protein
MYFILSMILLFAVLFVVSHVTPSPLEKFNNNNARNNTTNKNNQSTLSKMNTGPPNDGIPCAQKTPIKQVQFYNKYDATGCIKCPNPPKCANNNTDCYTENTFYYTLDNCIQEGNCRLPEDPVNMFPTCVHENKNTNANANADQTELSAH